MSSTDYDILSTLQRERFAKDALGAVGVGQRLEFETLLVDLLPPGEHHGNYRQEQQGYGE